MGKLDELKEKYSNLMIKAWNENKDIVIESFVEYYGEKYRDLITSRINEIEFVYYAPISKLDFVDNLISNLPDSITGDYIEYRDTYRLTPNDKDDESKNRVGTTCEELFCNEEYKKNISDILKNKYFPTFTPIRVNNKDIRNISIPIFISGEKTIIHEIIHAISYTPLATVYDNDKVVDSACKLGLDYGLLNNNIDINDVFNINNDERPIDELITEKVSLEIENIFFRRGGKLVYFKKVELESSYVRYLYLIKDFYEKFKDIINESKITQNKNLLIKKLGENNYQQFLSLINRDFINGQATKEILKLLEENKKHYPKILEVVNLMEQHKNISDSIETMNLEDHYQELENEGYTVTPLDNKIK